jgi:hypothetical protein
MNFNFLNWEVHVQRKQTTTKEQSLSKKTSLIPSSLSLPSNEIKAEFLSRINTFFGEKGLHSIQESFVIVRLLFDLCIAMSNFDDISAFFLCSVFLSSFLFSLHRTLLCYFFSFFHL